MDERTQRTIRRRVEQCHENMIAASILMEADLPRVAISRAYYAVFYIATAVLLTKGIVRSKHAGLRAAFSEFFVRGGEIEPEYAHILGRAQSLRQEADYAEDADESDMVNAQTLVADAQIFVARMERYLRGVGAIE